MAKYGDKKSFIFKDKEGKETAFTLLHPGLMGADMIMDEMRNEHGKTNIVELRKQLFEHVIRAGEHDKVDYNFFEDQPHGASMLKEVTKAAQDYIFPKA